FQPDATRVGITSFAVAGHDSAAVARYLAREHGIGVRDGLFCAHPLVRRLLYEAAARLGRPLPPTAVRASIGLSTTVEDIDRLVTALGTLPCRRRDRDHQVTTHRETIVDGHDERWHEHLWRLRFPSQDASPRLSPV